jgi:hypothetical protein
MNLWQPGSGRRKAPAGVIFLVLLCAAPHARSQEFVADAGWRDVSLAEYRQHLEDLDVLVSSCQAAQAKKDAAQMSSACNPKQIGPDNRVHWQAGAAAETREVRYDWLRAALGFASKKDHPAQTATFTLTPGAKNQQPPSADSLLAQARQRLQQDAKQAGGPEQAGTGYANERKALNTILAERAYRGVTEVSPRERFLEWFYNLLDKFLASLVRLGSRAPWIAWALRGLLLAAIATAFIWLLIRIERRARVKLVPDEVPAPDAPSARDWQLWYQDAGDMAAKHRWREAIHFLYWASIALLESRRLWPADRARTPREYLRLLAESDPRKTSLTDLTRSFERTWYGGRSAAASDFEAALELAAALGVAAK